MPELEDTSPKKQPLAFKKQDKKEETKENLENKEMFDDKAYDNTNSQTLNINTGMPALNKDINKGLIRSESITEPPEKKEKNIFDTPNIGGNKVNDDDMPESGMKTIGLLVLNSDKMTNSKETGPFKSKQEKNKESIASFRDPAYVNNTFQNQQDNHNYSLNNANFSPTNFGHGKAQSNKHLTGIGGNSTQSNNFQSNAAIYNMLSTNDGMKQFVDQFMKVMSSQQSELGNSGKNLGFSSLKIKNDDTDKLKAIEELKEKLESSEKEKTNIIKKYQEKERLLLERVNKLESLLQASDKWDIVSLERQNKDYETKIINLSRQISSLQIQLNEEKMKQNNSAGEIMILKQKMIDEICKYKEFNNSMVKKKEQHGRSVDLNHSENLKLEAEQDQGFDRGNNTFFMQSNRKLEKLGDISQETSGTVNYASKKGIENTNDLAKDSSIQRISPSQKLSNEEKDNKSLNNDTNNEEAITKKSRRISNTTFFAAKKLLQTKKDKIENS